MGWADPHTVTLLVQTAQGYAVRDLDIQSGEYAVVNVPPSFKKLRPGGAAAPTLSMAPDGRGLAVLEPPAGPLKPAALSVYRRSGNSFDSVQLHNIPLNFWAAGSAWGASGNELFLSARPYVFPDQPYSVGRLDLQTGSFVGVVLKANLDLISQLAVLPGRQLLLARCSGYRQEYPAEPVIALWDYNTGESSLLHARARALSLSVLDDKQALLLGSSGPTEERWILAAHESRLRRLDKGLVARSTARYLSPDGQWLGLVVPGKELAPELDARERYVAMQETGSGRTIATAVPCLQFAFAPDSAHFAALAKDGTKVYYYQLPRAEPKAMPAPAAPPEQTDGMQRNEESSRSPGTGY
jgi:hypothetical protein